MACTEELSENLKAVASSSCGRRKQSHGAQHIRGKAEASAQDLRAHDHMFHLLSLGQTRKFVGGRRLR